MNNRATRAIVASLSLIAIIAIGIPWVDEYRKLSSETEHLYEMDDQFAQVQQSHRRLDEIESKLNDELKDHLIRSVDPEKAHSIRSTLIELIRDSGGRLRSLELGKGRERPWAIEGDDPRLDSMPLYSEESEYVLFSHEIELRIDGTVETVAEVMRRIASRGWYMTTSSMMLMPTEGNLPLVSAEMRLRVFGLIPKPEDAGEQFARRSKNKSFVL